MGGQNDIVWQDAAQAQPTQPAQSAQAPAQGTAPAQQPSGDIQWDNNAAPTPAQQQSKDGSDPALKAPEYGSDEWYASKLPEGSDKVLSAAKKYLVDPFEQHVERIREGAKQFAAGTVTTVNELAHPDYMRAQVEAHAYAPGSGIVEDPVDTASREHPMAMGVSKAVAGTVAGVAGDPRNWPLMGAGEALPLLNKLMGVGFTAMMSKDAYAGAKQLAQNWDNLSPEQRWEIGSETGLNTVMATLAATHTAGDVAGKTGEAVRVAKEKTQQSFRKALTPDGYHNKNIGGTDVPTRPTGKLAQMAEARQPEMAENFLAEKTAPAVAEGVSKTIQEGAGIEGDHPLTTEDPYGLSSMASAKEKEYQAPVQKIDSISDNAFSNAQEARAAAQGDFSKAGKEEWKKQSQILNNLWEEHRSQLEADGVDVDAAKKAWGQKVALETIEKAMRKTTQISESIDRPYDLKAGKTLGTTIKNLLQHDDAPFQKIFGSKYAEVKPVLEDFSRTLNEQSQIAGQDQTPLDALVSKLGKRIVLDAVGGGIGTHFGGGYGGAAGIAAMDFFTNKASDMASKWYLGKILTTPKAMELVNNSLKLGGDPVKVGNQLKTVIFNANPTNGEVLAKKLADLWHDERGEAGLPGSLPPVGEAGHSQDLRDFSKQYTGKDLDTTKTDKDERGSAIADAYDKMKHDPTDPKVRASYDALIKETKDQWKALKERGYTISTSPEQPYANEKQMLQDIRDNKHITVWEGGQPPSDHPMSENDPESGLSNNTLFRAVHDILGHGKEGHDFSEAGEENAYRQHAQMYSDAARPALATETKGQASWVFNHEGVRNGESKPGDMFPEQKAAILPEEFHGGKKSSPDADIADQHNENGGSSVVNGKNLKDGYTVSVRKDLEQVLPKDKITPEDVAAYRARPDVQKVLNDDPRAFVGTWANDGKTYMDVSVHVPDKATARKLGVANKQLAIYDLKNKETVALPHQEYSFNENPAETNNAHSVTTRDAAGNKVGELTAQETGNVANRQVTVRSNQIYDAAERGQGHGKAQILSLLGNVPEDVKAVKSDISTTKDAQRVWESLERQYPEAVTKKVVGKGDSAKSVWTVDMDKFRSSGENHMADLAKQALPESPAVVARPTADPVKAYRQSLAANEIGTRNPKSVDATGVNNPTELSGLGALNEADRMSPARTTQAGKPVLGVKQKLVAALADYKDNGISQLLDANDPDAAIEKYVNHVKDNLKWLHGATPEAIRGVAKQWYETAHNVTKDIAEKNGVTHAQAAAVTAALSPKNDWNNNVGQAQRLIEHYAKDRNHAWTSKMDAAMSAIRNSEAVSEPLKRALDDIRGKKFKQLTAKSPEALRAKQAMWMRVLDEAHGSSDTPVYNPNGTVTGSQTLNWGQVEPIAKALSILEDGSVDNINRVMGQGHKIRNFYNNIINPWSDRGHTTIDTHAVGAGHLKPYSQEDTEVAHNFGSGNKAGTPSPAKHAATGIGGSYSVHEEAYRRAAKDLGIQPRELQSITWEGIRSLMGDEKKTPELRRAVTNIWRAHEAGELSINQAREEIVKASGGFSKPSWMSEEDWERNPTEEGDTSFDGGQ